MFIFFFWKNIFFLFHFILIYYSSDARFSYYEWAGVPSPRLTQRSYVTRSLHSCLKVGTFIVIYLAGGLLISLKLKEVQDIAWLVFDTATRAVEKSVDFSGGRVEEWRDREHVFVFPFSAFLLHLVLLGFFFSPFGFSW